MSTDRWVLPTHPAVLGAVPPVVPECVIWQCTGVPVMYCWQFRHRRWVTPGFAGVCARHFWRVARDRNFPHPLHARL